VDIPCADRNNMVAIGSTVKQRALTLRARFGAYPESECSARSRRNTGVLMLEAATGLHSDNVTYREVQDSDGPTRLDFAASWLEANDNPTLAPFLALLRRRYPDRAVSPRR
jgi:hypothetical protein